ncbi:hypothetical protein J2Z79_000917 [Symbiobacterium terraclitae]|uniref:Uncharacterized protein n=1 Tax=Symbiobacterium terraclitae TaxID=557451 RepID=A0ABS4JPS0_9FIRM|nr:hypothetical protein [Symbiobacterium terraclitae]MBP2017534.1 hypothetical protein [Symbiobacterium terraclitae]
MPNGSEFRRDDVLTTVTQDGQAGWQFVVTSPDGAVTLESGPGLPPIGNGSIRLATGTNGDWSAEIRNTAFNGVPLRELTDLRYWTYGVQNNGQQWPYIILQIDHDGDGDVDDLLFFEPGFQTPGSGNPNLPDQGLPVLNTWQDWNALAGGWWSENGIGGLTPGTGVGPLSQYLAAEPDSTIVNSASGLGGVRVLQGFASPDDVFLGYVDAFSIQTRDAGITTTFNFEPFLTPPSPPRPRPGGLALAGARGSWPLFTCEKSLWSVHRSRPFIVPGGFIDARR